MKKIFFISFFMAFLFWACEDKDTPTPAPDPTPYVNKFNCKINGKYWEVKPKQIGGILSQGNTIVSEFLYRDSILSISINDEKTNQDILIRIPFYLNTFEKVDTFSENLYTRYNNISNKCSCVDYYNIDKKYKNEFILLTKDKENQIIKGSFNINCISTKFKDTIQITEGYFDYSYK